MSWKPTKFDVVVFGAKDLPIKGHNGYNNSYVKVCMKEWRNVTNIFSYVKAYLNNSETVSGEKQLVWMVNRQAYFETQKVQHCSSQVQWKSIMELEFPASKKDTAEIVFKVYHEGWVRQFLGMVSLPINDLNTTEPIRKWYPLQCKPGKGKSEYRGEIEIQTTLIVKNISDN